MCTLGASVRVPGGWGRGSAIRETGLDAPGVGRREEGRSLGAPVGFRALARHPTVPRGRGPAHLPNCLLCTQHNLLVARRPHERVAPARDLPRSKGSWRKRSCTSPPLAERKWGQLCLGLAENSRENTRELKILVPQIFPGCQQVCRKLAEGKAWLTPPLPYPGLPDPLPLPPGQEPTPLGRPRFVPYR